MNKKGKSQEPGAGKSEVDSPKSEDLKAERLKAKGTMKPEAGSPKKRIKSQEPRVKKPVPEPGINENNASPTPETKELTTDHSSFTTNMDVLHHPQLDHKPKPWKEYLLEGFMIFIAVMMGFIAENIREDITNNEHVKQLTSQLVHDLKADTAQLDTIYRAETKITESNSSLIALLQQPLQKADTRQIQKQVANSHSLWLFHPSAGAISAIKNELHLKQFSNSDIISRFATYEKHIELLHTAQDVNLQYQRLYLDPFLTQHLTPANMVAAFDDNAIPTATMRNLTQGDLDQLASDVVLIRIVSNELLRDNRLVDSDAVELLKYVTKQYGLEGE